MLFTTTDTVYTIQYTRTSILVTINYNFSETKILDRIGKRISSANLRPCEETNNGENRESSQKGK